MDGSATGARLIVAAPMVRTMHPERLRSRASACRQGNGKRRLSWVSHRTASLEELSTPWVSELRDDHRPWCGVPIVIDGPICPNNVPPPLKIILKKSRR